MSDLEITKANILVVDDEEEHAQVMCEALTRLGHRCDVTYSLGGAKMRLVKNRYDVIDTGPGVPPDVAARIFTAYYSTKKGGTGLGLPMSKRIAQEHGGDLSVKSEPGKGSDFTLRLPLK